MIVYRIAKTRRRISDLSGIGAKLYGGRWNNKGTGIVYTSESRSLATVEYLVHVPISIIPDGLSIASIKIPDSIKPKHVLPGDLPNKWRDYPPPPELAEIGTKWALSNETLLLRVPSAVVENEFNILINPQHPDMKRITISKIENFRFDKRLTQRKAT
ncbi:MAG: RES family NAD+ phosphorylase [Thermodesulfobacteriota bacterium]